MSKTFNQFMNEFPQMQQGIAKVIAQTSQILQIVPIANDPALVHLFGREVSQGGVASRRLNESYPATESGQVVPAQEKIGIMGAEVATDVRMSDSTQGKARADEIGRRSMAIGRYFDAQFARGKGTTDAKELVGMRDRITGNQLITAGANGADLTLDLFHALLDQVEDQGGGKIVWMNKKLFRAFKKLVIASAGGATVADLKGTILQYEDCKIIVSLKDHLGNEVLEFDETQGTYTTASSIYCFSPGNPGVDKVGVQVIMSTSSIQRYDQGVVGSQYKDLLELAATFAIYQERAAARLQGVKKPA